MPLHAAPVKRWSLTTGASAVSTADGVTVLGSMALTGATEAESESVKGEVLDERERESSGVGIADIMPVSKIMAKMSSRRVGVEKRMLIVVVVVVVVDIGDTTLSIVMRVRSGIRLVRRVDVFCVDG